mgnify:CR=1 FL=1
MDFVCVMIFAILIKMAFILLNFFFYFKFAHFNHLKLIIICVSRSTVICGTKYSVTLFFKKQGSSVIESIERFLDSLFVIKCKAEKNKQNDDDTGNIRLI